MSTVAIIVLVLIVLLLALAAGGSIAQKRRLERTRGAFDASLRAVEQDLVAARAQDRGWERSTLDAAAREAYAEARPGGGSPTLTLVRVIDRPGTDEDQAVYRVEDGAHRAELTLGRSGGAWRLERLS